MSTYLVNTSFKVTFNELGTGAPDHHWILDVGDGTWTKTQL